MSAICTYGGGGTLNEAANGSPPTVWTEPSGPGSANTGVVFFPGPGNATLLALPLI